MTRKTKPPTLATVARHYITTALRHDPRAVKLIAQYGREGIDRQYLDELTDEHGGKAGAVIAALVEECRKQYGVPAADHRSEPSRRAKGDARINYRTTEEIKAKAQWLADDEDTSVSDLLDLLVEGEWESRQEQRRIAEYRRANAR